MQFMKDHAYHKGTQQATYDTMFGTEAKFRAEKLEYSKKTFKRSKD
jgi:hypothetical protein